MKDKSIKHENYQLDIIIDDMAESPITAFDNVGQMVLKHGKYDLPNEIDLDFDEFMSWNEVYDFLSQKYKFILPVYMLDHSGLTISIKPFGDKWDSGQIGYIVSNEDHTDYGGETLEILNNEVEIFSEYLEGNCYGFRITKGDEEIDSCFGFYGDDHKKSGLIDSLFEANLPEETKQFFIASFYI
jgi:hypothetical protein